MGSNGGLHIFGRADIDVCALGELDLVDFQFGPDRLPDHVAHKPFPIILQAITVCGCGDALELTTHKVMHVSGKSDIPNCNGPGPVEMGSGGFDVDPGDGAVGIQNDHVHFLRVDRRKKTLGQDRP